MILKNEELVEQIKQGLLKEGEVKITNLGFFRISKTKERSGRNPKTGEPITISARTKVKFKPAKTLTQYFNGNN